MKPVKHQLAVSDKVVNVPELTNKKGRPSSPWSSKSKQKRKAKLVRDKLEPMVLRSPPTGESILRYALPIPSSKTDDFMSEEELIRKVTEHLKMVVSTLEEAYGYSIQNGETPIVKPEQEGSTLSVGDDLSSFLICCSQFAAQLEEAVKEERNILESLFKWFQRQVNQMEEISKDQTISEAELPASDTTVTLSIAQLVSQVQKLEELKNRLKQQSKYSLKTMLSKPTDSEKPSDAVQRHEHVKQKIEEFIKTHSSEEVVDVSASEPQTSYSLPNRLNAMLKIFEKQSNMLTRAMNDQSLLEAKYKQMQSDFQVLSEEKLLLENELQKLKDMEKTKPTYDRIKKTGKMEKKKDRGKPENSEKDKPVVQELKTKEDLLQVQKVAHALESENKILQEKLKQALQEAERAKHQVDYFLNQGKKLVTSEGKTKTTMEMDNSKIKVKGENSLEKETGKALVADANRQRTSDKIQEHQQISVVQNGSPTEKSSEKKRASPAISDLSQILKSQDGSAFSKNANEVFADEDPSHILSSETHDKSFARVLSSSETQDSLPSRTSIKEIQNSPSARTLLQGSETATAPFISPTVVIKRKPMGSDISKADVLEEKLQSNIEKQTSQEATEFQAHDGESTENLILDNEAVSNTDMQMLKAAARMKRRNAFLIIQEKDSIAVEDQLPEDIALVLRSQFQAKNFEATRNESSDTHDEVPDEKLMLAHQDSVSKTQMQIKKQGTPTEERFNTHDKVLDEKLMLEHKESMSKTQMQVKKERTSIEKRLPTQDEVPDENRMLEHQDSMSESEIQMKKQRTHKMESLTTHDDIPDRNLMLEHQDSVSKLQMQVKKQMTSTGEEHNTLDEVSDETLIPKHQDSVSKTQVQLKKQKTSIEELLNTHFGVPDENLMIEPQDSVSKLQKQVEKQITSRRGRRHTYMGEQDENLIFLKQDSVSNLQMEVKKQIISRGERRNTFPPENQKNNMISVENLFPEEEVLFSRNQSQTKKFGATREKNLHVKNEVASELPDTAENLPAINPSTSDLILQLDLNKVLETDVEYLKDVIGRRMLMGEMQMQAKSLPETDTKHFPDVTGRGTIKGEIKTQSKSRSETDRERLTDTVGREKLIGEMTQLKGRPDMNLLKTRYLSTEDQDVFTKYIGQSKFSTNAVNFSPLDNQGPPMLHPHKPPAYDWLPKGAPEALFKNKNILSPQQEDFSTRHITANKFPTNVINLSPFAQKVMHTDIHQESASKAVLEEMPKNKDIQLGDAQVNQISKRDLQQKVTTGIRKCPLPCLAPQSCDSSELHTDREAEAGGSTGEGEHSSCWCSRSAISQSGTHREKQSVVGAGMPLTMLGQE
ncbi:coiled-coil domain-containing protein 7 [Equus quagga]|uniref:coiled-coil domain-containing protein 7 n=1 Tax=Equus quagga TaxID=89248 RepID=UPI001EE162BC|nr:coiled-coil domain-containing protein 7 [Equus quagga]